MSDNGVAWMAVILFLVVAYRVYRPYLDQILFNSPVQSATNSTSTNTVLASSSTFVVPFG